MNHVNAQIWHFVQFLQLMCHDHLKTLSLENRASSGHMRTLSAQLSEAKATFLHDLRRSFFQETPFPREDMDVEGIVKRAVDIFDHKRKEIMNDN